MDEVEYLERRRSNWRILTNDGANITAYNELTRESFSGTQAAYNAIHNEIEFIRHRGDRIVGGSVIVNALHYLTHRGLLFHHASKHTLSVGTPLLHLIVTGTNTVHLQPPVVNVESAPCEIYFYEDTTTSALGTPTVLSNNNRVSTNTPSVTVYEGPTVTGNGTQLDYELITGSNNTGGTGALLSREIILKPSSKYLLSLSKISGPDALVSVSFELYEPAGL